MTDLRTTHLPVEVLSSGSNPDLRATHVPVEVLTSGSNPDIRATHLVVEVLTNYLPYIDLEISLGIGLEAGTVYEESITLEQTKDLELLQYIELSESTTLEQTEDVALLPVWNTEETLDLEQTEAIGLLDQTAVTYYEESITLAYELQCAIPIPKGEAQLPVDYDIVIEDQIIAGESISLGIDLSYVGDSDTTIEESLALEQDEAVTATDNFFFETLALSQVNTVAFADNIVAGNTLDLSIDLAVTVSGGLIFEDDITLEQDEAIELLDELGTPVTMKIDMRWQTS